MICQLIQYHPEAPAPSISYWWLFKRYSIRDSTASRWEHRKISRISTIHVISTSNGSRLIFWWSTTTRYQRITYSCHLTNRTSNLAIWSSSIGLVAAVTQITGSCVMSRVNPSISEADNRPFWSTADWPGLREKRTRGSEDCIWDLSSFQTDVLLMTVRCRNSVNNPERYISCTKRVHGNLLKRLVHRERETAYLTRLGSFENTWAIQIPTGMIFTIRTHSGL